MIKHFIVNELKTKQLLSCLASDSRAFFNNFFQKVVKKNYLKIYKSTFVCSKRFYVFRSNKHKNACATKDSKKSKRYNIEVCFT